MKYAGLIKVPANKDEPETIVKGLHQSIVNKDVFDKVQFILNKKSRYKQKANKLNEQLPLRVYLKCSNCGSNLTGSGSRSKTGDRHYYYHCNPRKGCGERFKVKDAHMAFDQLIDEITPSKEVCDLFKLILEKNYQSAEKSKYQEKLRVEKEIEKLEDRGEKLLEKLLDGVVANDIYSIHDKKIRQEINQKSQEVFELGDHEKELNEYIDFGIYLLENFKSLYNTVGVEVKNKLLSSILEEKLEYKDKEYRTPKFKEGFEFIYMNINKLEVVITKREDNLSKISPLVLEMGLEPIRTLQSTGF